MNDACCALYITALVAGVLELESNVLHVPDPTVRCICTPIMVAIPLFPFELYSFTSREVSVLIHFSYANFCSSWEPFPVSLQKIRIMPCEILDANRL
jgi:hypothetical protein